MRGNHSVVIPPPCPTALGDNPAIGQGGRSIERQSGYTAQQNLQSNLPYGREGRIPVETALQFGKTQGRQQHLAVMVSQFVKNSVRPIAGMDGDIGIDEIGHDRVTPLVPLAHGDIDRLSFFDG